MNKIKNKIRDYSFIIRVFFSNILNYILLKILGNIPNLSKNVRYGKRFIYYETKKMKIKEFDYSINTRCFNLPGSDSHYSSDGKIFNWKTFLNDININGIKNNPIAVLIFNTFKFNIYLFDGFHRMKAYETIHGVDSEMLIDIYVHYDYLKIRNKHKKQIVNNYIDTKKRLNSKTYD